MLITKGSDKFTIVDIAPNEMSNIFDGMQNGRFYLQELLKQDDKSLAGAMNKPVKKIPEIRKIMQDKIDFYEKHMKKIMSYAKK